MQVCCFHLMPWAYLPEDFAQTHNSAWVTTSNSRALIKFVFAETQIMDMFETRAGLTEKSGGRDV